MVIDFEDYTNDQEDKTEAAEVVCHALIEIMEAIKRRENK